MRIQAVDPVCGAGLACVGLTPLAAGLPRGPPGSESGLLALLPAEPCGVGSAVFLSLDPLSSPFWVQPE